MWTNGMKKCFAGLVGLIALTLASNAALAGEVRRNVTRVAPRSDDSYSLYARRGEDVTVTVRGDGDTDLDCFVEDNRGHLVAIDDDGTDMCILEWNPDYSQTYTVTIRNLGGVTNRYQILTSRE